VKHFYLLAAVIGAIIPYVFFTGHFRAEGFAPGSFLAAVVATPAAAGAFADLLISSLVFWIFMFAADRRGPVLWLFVLLHLAIGLSCALPAYLYWRERGREAGAVSTA